ncbi:syndecan domain-containing protein [Ditylenchus destructor]|uniref:Syndecan domain-containing protein n=1 Tax=Ditylenchus destructor TaxID=166010 RepID=A0AAD4N4I5_9BILA|nr:syndecan domain-containing protein [Ditylenchus destructor]
MGFYSGLLIRLLCCIWVVTSLPDVQAVISTNAKDLARNSGTKENVVEGSGTAPKGTDFRIPLRPDADTIQSSGVSPDDEDGDVEEGSGDVVEGSGRPPAQIVITTSISPVTSTESTTTPSTARPRHETTAVTPYQPQWVTTTTTRQTPLTPNTRPPSSSPQPPYGTEGETFEMLKPGILAAVTGGAVVGVLMTILLVMFIVYRLRKKDEGSYSLDEPRQPPHYSYAYQKASTKEFYA